MWSSHSMLRYRLFKLEAHSLYTSLIRGRSQSPELPCQDNIHPQGSSAVLPRPLPQRLLCCPSPWRTAPDGQETSRQGRLIVFISPCQDRKSFSWFFSWKSKGCDDHNNSIRLEEKTKKCWNLKQRLSCSSHPLLCSLLTVISPCNWTTAWTSFPVTLSYHIPCLCDTICFLLQLFSSIAKHSSEVTPSPLICSQNPLPAPWVGYVLDPRSCSCITVISYPLSLSFSPPVSFLGRECPCSKPFSVKPVSTHPTKSWC